MGEITVSWDRIQMAALLILPSEVIEIIWGFWLLRVCACWLCVDGCLPCLCCDRACCTLAHCQSLHTALRHFFSRLQTVPCLLVACYHESMLLADWLSNGDIPEEWEVVMFPLYCFVVNKKFCIPALSCYFQSSPERELHQSCHYMSNTQNVFSLDFFVIICASSCSATGGSAAVLRPKWLLMAKLFTGGQLHPACLWAWFLPPLSFRQCLETCWSEQAKKLRQPFNCGAYGVRVSLFPECKCSVFVQPLAEFSFFGSQCFTLYQLIQVGIGLRNPRKNSSAVITRAVKNCCVLNKLSVSSLQEFQLLNSTSLFSICWLQEV